MIKQHAERPECESALPAHLKTTLKALKRFACGLDVECSPLEISQLTGKARAVEKRPPQPARSPRVRAKALLWASRVLLQIRRECCGGALAFHHRAALDAGLPARADRRSSHMRTVHCRQDKCGRRTSRPAVSLHLNQLWREGHLEKMAMGKRPTSRQQGRYFPF